MAKKRIDIIDCIEELERIIEDFGLYMHDVPLGPLEGLLEDLKEVNRLDARAIQDSLMGR